VKSSPTLVDDFVLIGSYDTHLYALDRNTGKLRWKLETEEPVHATPAVQNGVIYIAGCDEHFRAVRLTDGKTLFDIPLDAYTGASTLVDGERAYVGTFAAEVFAIDVRSRKIVWRYRDSDGEFPYYSSAAVDKGHVIVGGRDKVIHAIETTSGGRVYVGSSDGKLYVLDAATGEKRWEFDAGAAITASPAIAAGRIVIGAQDGRLYCFG
jgi:outer membrane protein assembly factor BamB